MGRPPFRVGPGIGVGRSLGTHGDIYLMQAARAGLAYRESSPYRGLSLEDLCPSKVGVMPWRRWPWGRSGARVFTTVSGTETSDTRARGPGLKAISRCGAFPWVVGSPLMNCLTAPIGRLAFPGARRGGGSWRVIPLSEFGLEPSKDENSRSLGPGHLGMTPSRGCRGRRRSS